MFSLGVWLTTLVLEMLLLVRALQGRFLRKYSLFYVYLGIVFFQSLALLIVYLQSAKYYRPFYWYAEFVSVVLGCGVVWGIYRQALRRFPGAARMARNVFLFMLLMWCITLWSYHAVPLPETEPRVEHDYRLLAATTRKGLHHARALLGRALRP